MRCFRWIASRIDTLGEEWEDEVVKSTGFESVMRESATSSWGQGQSGRGGLRRAEEGGGSAEGFTLNTSGVVFQFKSASTACEAQRPDQDSAAQCVHSLRKQMRAVAAR